MKQVGDFLDDCSLKPIICDRRRSSRQGLDLHLLVQYNNMVRDMSGMSAFVPLTPSSPHLQEPSLALVPSSAGPSSIAHASSSALDAHGLHDTLEYGPRSIAAETAPKHPLEHRLSQVGGRVGLRQSMRYVDDEV